MTNAVTTAKERRNENKKIRFIDGLISRLGFFECSINQFLYRPVIGVTHKNAIDSFFGEILPSGRFILNSGFDPVS